MLSAPRTIPGFYYDPERKKYFRLLPNHAAPTVAFYTVSTARQRYHENQTAEKRRVEHARQLERKRRPHIWNNSFAKVKLFRELGGKLKIELNEDFKKVYTLGLQRRCMLELESGGEMAAFAVHASDDQREMTIAIGTITGSVRKILVREADDGMLQCDQGTLCSLHHSWSQVTSINISPCRLLLSAASPAKHTDANIRRATFLGEHNHPSIYFTRLPDPGATESVPPTGVVTILNSARSVWTSCASPHASGEFLLGTSSSVVHITDHPYDTVQRYFRVSSDVFTCCFLQNRPEVFACGARDGTIRLFDLRANASFGLEETRPETIIRHESTITHLRPISEVEVLANGVKGCAAYDLRFLYPASPLKLFPEPNTATMKYSAMSRDEGCIPGLGFDVNIKQGVIAQAGPHSSVNLFSLRTGESLKWEGDERIWKHPCRSLRFDSSEITNGLWTVDGSALDYYSWK